MKLKLKSKYLFLFFLGGVFFLNLFFSSSEPDFERFRGIVFWKDFPQAKRWIPKYFSYFPKQKPKKEILGGIVSHHIPTAFPFVAGFYRKIASLNPKRVFILGPDHFHSASFWVVSGDYDFDTPFGVLRSDKKVIRELEKRGLIKIDNKVFKKEHSILSQIYFVKYLYPKAKVVPLVFKPYLKKERIQKLSQALEEYKKESIFIVSIDFSHNLSFKEALEKDQNTKDRLKRFEYEKITSRECDSPPALKVLFSMAKRGGYKIKNIKVSNSYFFSGVSQKTTGYISLIFER